MPEGIEGQNPKESDAVLEYFSKADLVANLTERRGIEGARNVSRVFFDALSLLPLAVEKYGKGRTDSYHTQFWAHQQAQQLYMDGLKAVGMQGADVPENEIVRLVASQGIVAETQALIGLAAKSKETSSS